MFCAIFCDSIFFKEEKERIMCIFFLYFRILDSKSLLHERSNRVSSPI